MSETKLCPFCSEEIKATAIKCRYCGSMLSDAPSPSGSLTGIDLVRQALGDRYDVLEKIGSGGMATVYKAIQRSLGRTVALKVIHQNLVHDEEFVKRFHREAQISASLQHPNIVTIHDVGEAQGVHYMAMEYLEGTDLHQMISKSGRLGEQQSLSYVLSVARALEYVHKRGLIHRDIKSSNIFICSDADDSHTGLDADNGQRLGSRAVLMDFGIAHAASGTRLTRTGAVIGSPEYMSPEQAEAKPVDHRTDIYSLGVVLYECLTGRVPFKTDSYISTIRKVIDEPPDANMLNHVDKDLRQFTLGLMSKRAHDRPASASRVLGLLGELLVVGGSGKPSAGDVSGVGDKQPEEDSPPWIDEEQDEIIPEGEDTLIIDDRSDKEEQQEADQERNEHIPAPPGPHQTQKNKTAVWLLSLLGLVLVIPVLNHQYSLQQKVKPFDFGILIDDRDGKSYKTIQIGNQVWMAENLNYNAGSGSWCYDDKASNCNTYGRLYNWETALNVCPPGWRLPSRAEWSQLRDFVGGNSGTKLKARSGWRRRSSDWLRGNGTDDFGFSALPGGHRSIGGSFYNLRTSGSWWSSTESSYKNAVFYGMTRNIRMVSSHPSNKADGFSVRCVREP